MPRERANGEFSEDARFLLVIVLLFVFYPVGLVLMWAWTNWPRWVKILISLPVLVGILLFFVGMILFAFALRHGLNDNWQTEPRFRYYRGYYMQQQPVMMPQSQEVISPTLSPIPSATY